MGATLRRFSQAAGRAPTGASAWCGRKRTSEGDTLLGVSVMRRCSKTACSRIAVATLTYNYAEQTAVLGPLATFAEPHSYDLCATHALRMTVPQGWTAVRLVEDLHECDDTDDLLAVADAVEARRPARGSEAKRRRKAAREAGETDAARATQEAPDAQDEPPAPRRPALRVLRDQ